MNKYGYLVGEMDMDSVSVFSLDNIRVQTLPRGARVLILGPRNLSGYVMVQHKNEILEVWHGTLSSCPSANIQN